MNQFMARRNLVLVSFLVGISFMGCSRSRLSEREVRREQIRLNAETKKRELSAIAGDYSGVLITEDDRQQAVALRLDVLEAPFNDNGGIDPVMMPQLSGFLKFSFGSANEYLGFSITRGEYDPKRSVLELVVSQDAAKYEVQLSLVGDQVGFSGGWQAPTLKMSGQMTLRRGAATNIAGNGGGGSEPGGDSLEQLSGAYKGYANDDARNAHYAAVLVLSTTNIPAQGTQLTAVISLQRGGVETEKALWSFDRVEFNPLRRTLILSKDGVREKFEFTLERGVLSGKWSASILGPMGDIVLSRTSPVASRLPRNAARSGAHSVCLRNGDISSAAELRLTKLEPSSTGDGQVTAQSNFVFLDDKNVFRIDDSNVFCDLVDTKLDFITGRFSGTCPEHPNTGKFLIIGTFDEVGFNGSLEIGSIKMSIEPPGSCSGESP